MMVTVEIPDMRFDVGDVVYLPNDSNIFGIYLKITDYLVELSGVIIGSSMKEYAPFIKQAYYFGELMQGSVCDTVKLRPLVTFLTIDKSQLEKGILAGKSQSILPLFSLTDSVNKIGLIIETERKSGFELIDSFNYKQ
jgi:hypothetical protein